MEEHSIGIKAEDLDLFDDIKSFPIDLTIVTDKNINIKKLKK